MCCTLELLETPVDAGLRSRIPSKLVVAPLLPRDPDADADADASKAAQTAALPLPTPEVFLFTKTKENWYCSRESAGLAPSFTAGNCPSCTLLTAEQRD
eukprot:6190191-Pleurochrysis_carterae.AAC.2